MNKTTEYQQALSEIETLRKAMEPIVDRIDQIYIDYWNAGYSTEIIASHLGVLRSTVRRKLATLGIDWKEREEPKPEPKEESTGPSWGL